MSEERHERVRRKYHILVEGDGIPPPIKSFKEMKFPAGTWGLGEVPHFDSQTPVCEFVSRLPRSSAAAVQPVGMEGFKERFLSAPFSVLPAVRSHCFVPLETSVDEWCWP